MELVGLFVVGFYHILLYPISNSSRKLLSYATVETHNILNQIIPSTNCNS